MARITSRELLRSASKLAIAAAAMTLLTGCGGFSSTMSSEASDVQVASSPREMTQPDDKDYVAGAAYWGARFEANKSDVDAAVNFARNLRLMGGARQAVTVMKAFVMNHPDDARVLAEYGKALTASGRATDAVPFLARASQIDGNDWSTLSAYGVALDQIGSHPQARDNYLAALNLSPNNASVQSNMALSYLLEGKVDQAEPILRMLVARPDATPQMRQNLAMVESIRGDHAAAEQLARTDLPKSDADNNLEVLNQLSASNAVDVEPLPAPPTAAPASAPAAPKPSAAVTPTAPVVTMAPVADDNEPTQSLHAQPPTPAAPPKPAAAAATAAETTSGTAAAPMPVSATTTTTTAPTKQIVTMAPIADDNEPVAKPAAPKPATPKVAAPKPAAATTATTAAAPTAAPAATPASAPAEATPTQSTPSASPTASSEAPAPAPAATAAPIQTTPDSSQRSESSDPFRRAKEINVAAAR